eukprot:833001-Prymnesium_polylepis.1
MCIRDSPSPALALHPRAPSQRARVPRRTSSQPTERWSMAPALSMSHWRKRSTTRVDERRIASRSEKRMYLRSARDAATACAHARSLSDEGLTVAGARRSGRRPR